MRLTFLLPVATIILFSCGGNKTTPETTTPAGPDQATAVKPADSTQKAVPAVPDSLSLTPLAIEAAQGQATFSMNNKTSFYFDEKANKGAIELSGSSYALDKYAFDGKTNSYTISGSGVSINAPSCVFKPVTSDCTYGTIPEVTITKGTAILVLKKVQVQDCPMP